MPIVVEVVSIEKYSQWFSEQVGEHINFNKSVKIRL
jgi:hypothetical protein